MFIKTFKFKKSLFFIAILFFVTIISFSWFYNFYSFAALYEYSKEDSDSKQENKFIKWVDFKVTYDALDKTSKLDINSHVKDENIKYNWIELLSYLACKYGVFWQI